MFLLFHFYYVDGGSTAVTVTTGGREIFGDYVITHNAIYRLGEVLAHLDVPGMQSMSPGLNNYIWNHINNELEGNICIIFLVLYVDKVLSPWLIT